MSAGIGTGAWSVKLTVAFLLSPGRVFRFLRGLLRWIKCRELGSWSRRCSYRLRKVDDTRAPLFIRELG
jgi:hypothetical protein